MIPIVISKNAPQVVCFAAEELQAYFTKILRAYNFQITIENPPSGSSAIFLGENTTFTTPKPFDHEGFGIFVTPVSASGVNRHIWIIGDDKDYTGTLFHGFDPRRSRKGTLFGVYTLLELLFGVRWYWPGQSGEILTMDSTQAAQMLNKLINSNDPIRGFFSQADTAYSNEWGKVELERYERPKFSWRHLYLVPEPKVKDEEIWKWYMRLRLGINKGGPYSFQQANHLKALLDCNTCRIGEELYQATNDSCYDCLGIVHNRVRGENQVCTTNALAKERIVDSIVDDAKEYGADYIFSVSPAEGKRYCECNTCRQLDHPELYGEDEGDRGLVLSDRVVTFVNELFTLTTPTNAIPLEQKFPELKLGLFSYNETKPAPRALLRMHPNIVISFTQFLSFFNNPIEKIITRNRLQDWLRKAQHLVIRDYIGQLSFGNIFTPQCDTIMEEIHHIQEFQQILGFYSETSSADLTVNHLNYYLLAKLLWDPNLTEEELREIKKEYFSLCYAEAGPLIWDFYIDLEHKFMSRPTGPLPHMEGIDEWLDEKTSEYWLTEINKAINIVGSSEAKERVNMLLASLDYTVALRDFFAAYKKLIGLGYPLNTHLKIKRKEVDYDGNDFSVTLKSIKDAANNVKILCGQLQTKITNLRSIKNTFTPEEAFKIVNGPKTNINGSVVAGVTTWVEEDLSTNDYSIYKDDAKPQVIYQVSEVTQVPSAQQWQDWINSFVDKKPIAGSQDEKIENHILYIRVGGLVETSQDTWTTYKYHYQWAREWVLKDKSDDYVKLNSLELYYFEMIYKVDNLCSSRWESESENPELAFVKKPNIPELRFSPCKLNFTGLQRLKKDFWFRSGYPSQQQWGKWLVFRQLFTVPEGTEHLIISLFLNAKGEYWIKEFKVVKVGNESSS